MFNIQISQNNAVLSKHRLSQRGGGKGVKHSS